MRPENLRAAALAIVAVAQFGGLPAVAQTSEVRELPAFDAIDVGGSVDLVVRQGSEFRVTVTAEDGELADLVTEVDRGTLQIHHKQQQQRSLFGFNRVGDYEVDVTLPRLRALDAHGGVDVRVDGTISGERLEIDASGAADLNLAVDVTELEVNTSGGSDITLVGSATRFNARSSGGSDLMANGMTVESADIRSSGGSDVMLDVTDSLVAHASGGSDIVYSGNPAAVDVHSSGGADVVRR